MKTVLIVIGTLFALGTAFVVGVVLLVGSAANEVSKEMEAEAKHDKPKNIAEGEPFTHDKYDIAAGWKIKSDEFGGIEVKNIKVTNISDDADFPMFTFDLMSPDGKDLLASIDCTSDEIGSGVTTKMDSCLSSESMPKGNYQVTVRDLW